MVLSLSQVTVAVQLRDHDVVLGLLLAGQGQVRQVLQEVVAVAHDSEGVYRNVRECAFLHEPAVAASA